MDKIKHQHKTETTSSGANIKIHKSWQKVLGEYFHKPEFKQLTERIRADYLDKSKTVYPPPSNIFQAFNETPFKKVKVVILGQDPYHNHGQAHGLCFSVPECVPAPPSLLNIFKEIQSDLHNNNKHQHKSEALVCTDLTRLAKQGVFLLNAVLSVLHKQPTSHASLGWEDFTDHVIKIISDEHKNIVFMLWGAYARGKVNLIDSEKHLILEAPHPSPLSAHRGFFGCKHFSQANDYLKKHKRGEIKW